MKTILIVCIFILTSCGAQEETSIKNETSDNGNEENSVVREVKVQKNTDSDSETVSIDGEEIFTIDGTSVDNNVVGNILVSTWTGMGGTVTSIYDIYDKRELMNIAAEGVLSPDSEYIYTCNSGGQFAGFFGYYSLTTLKTKNFSDEISNEGVFIDCTYSNEKITANFKSDADGKITEYIIDIENDTLSESN